MQRPLINVHDHARAAQAALSPAAWAYFSGGAANELTLRRNDAAWEQWGLRPRVL
jgi:4-hydroxymandelate oxidase